MKMREASGAARAAPAAGKACAANAGVLLKQYTCGMKAEPAASQGHPSLSCHAAGSPSGRAPLMPRAAGLFRLLPIAHPALPEWNERIERWAVANG